MSEDGPRPEAGPVTGTAPGGAALVAAAWDAVRQVAQPSGLVIHEVSEPREHREVELLLRTVWETADGIPPLPSDLLRMLAYTGAYVAAAECDGRLVAAAVGFVTAPRGEERGHLHSHIAGVVPGYRGRDLGFAIKLHQRAWALERGYEHITWTFDPLVRRNAHFNLNKLGARITQYLPDFYGEMADGLNKGQGSDRVLVDWCLHSAALDAGPGVARPRPEPAVLRCGPGDEPQRRGVVGGGRLRCEIPADIEALRRRDPGLGRRWREELRAVLQPALDGGAVVAAFDRDAGYLLDPPAGAIA